MALEYGVLRARTDLAKREDDGSTPHLQIRAVDATAQPWRVAVNVQSDDGSEVVFWIVDPLVGHPTVALARRRELLRLIVVVVVLIAHETSLLFGGVKPILRPCSKSPSSADVAPS